MFGSYPCLVKKDFQKRHWPFVLMKLELNISTIVI